MIYYQAMARKLRIHIPGALYHVIFRGNAGQPVFFSNADRYRLYLLLQEGTCRFGYRIHAFCLMSNHIHLLLQAGNVPLSKGMHNLAFRFTRWINVRESRSGHLFQGRYKAILVDADGYLLELVRYMHFNPVRAQMVTAPSDYPWSSHRAYLGDGSLPWLTTELVLAQLGNDMPQALRNYASFMAAGGETGYREEFYSGNHQGSILGDDRFVEKVLAQAGKMPSRPICVDRLKEVVLQEFGCTMVELGTRSQRRPWSLARASLGWLAMHTGAATLTEVGTWFGRDVGTMSAAVRRLEERAGRRREVRELLDRMLREVSSQEA